MPAMNLWGDLSDIHQNIRTPKSILEEQGRILTEATDGQLVGEVSDQSDMGRFIFGLDVRVPSMNNYQYGVVSISHDIDLYPVHLVDHRGRRAFDCATEQDYLAALREVLSSRELKNILARLLAQAK